MGRVIFIAAALIFSLAAVAATPAQAEWPNRSLTLVSAIEPALPWAEDQPNPQALILNSLVPRLSRELGVPVLLAEHRQGQGVLAANLAAGAKPDGYLMAALGPGAALARVIQGYTPYTWDDIEPLAIAWRTYPALVVRADFPADDLGSMPRSKSRLRLAHTGLAPMSSNTYQAFSAARAAGFAWTPVEVKALDPAVLLEDRADALVMPLGWLEAHPQADQFKVLTILTRDPDPPCGQGRPTLHSQGLAAADEPPLAFYLPAGVNERVRARLAAAVNNSLRQPAVARSVAEACLKLHLEDPDKAERLMGRAYEEMEAGLTGLAPGGNQ